MERAKQIFYAVSSLAALIALIVIAYKLVEQTASAPSPTKSAIDYTNMVVILLTTVTVIFSVCALALAVLGVIGFRSLKRDAGRFASQRAISEIASAFAEGGSAYEQIQDQFRFEDGQLMKWAERRIRIEVIAMLPAVIDRLQAGDEESALDDDAPTDEGQVD